MEATQKRCMRVFPAYSVFVLFLYDCFYTAISVSSDPDCSASERSSVS